MLSLLNIKLDFNYFSKNILFVLVRHGFATLVGLATSFIIVRIVSQQTFGEYQLALSIIGVLSLVSFSGLGIAVLNAVARGNDKSYFKAAHFSLKTSLLGSLAMMLIAAYFYYNDKNTLALAFLISAPLFPFLYSFRWEYFLIGKKDFSSYSLFTGAQKLFNAFSVLLGAYFVGSSALMFFLYGLSNVISNLFFHRRVKNMITAEKSEEDVIRYGIFMTAVNVIPVISGHIDKLLIAYLAGIQNLAIYAVALMIPNALKDLIKSVMNVVIPKIVERGQEYSKLKIKSAYWLVFFIGTVFSVGVIFLIPPAMNIIFPDSYGNAVIISQIISASFMPLPLVLLLQHYQISHKLKKEVTDFSVYTHLVKIILIIALVLMYGLVGAAIAYLATTWIQLFYVHFQVYIKRRAV